MSTNSADADVAEKQLQNGFYKKVNEREYDYMIDNKVHRVVIGKDKHDNWKIIDESCEEDLWFHVDKGPSSHVIIRGCDGEKLNKKLIKFAAMQCKFHSKMKKIKKVPVIYAKIKNLQKGTYDGSVICKDSKVIKV